MLMIVDNCDKLLICSNSCPIYLALKLIIMPNKIDPNKLHSSITLQRSLIAELDRIAVKEDRSRNKVIEILLVSQLKKYDGSKGLRPLEVEDR